MGKGRPKQPKSRSEFRCEGCGEIFPVGSRRDQSYCKPCATEKRGNFQIKPGGGRESSLPRDVEEARARILARRPELGLPSDGTGEWADA